LQPRCQLWPVGGQRLACGHYAHAVHQICGALRPRLKLAHALNLIAKQFNAHRLQSGDGPDVDDAAAPAKLAGLHHHRLL